MAATRCLLGLPAALALGLVLATAAAVEAQDLAPSLASGSASGSAAATVVAPPATTPAETVWRLPGSAASMRVSGEEGAMAWPVFVPSANATEIRRFQLAYKAAISVMPEASWLTLEINGQTIGRVPIAAPNRTKLLSFDVPPGVIAAGWNAVRLGVSQRHRVDCTIAATYELWTELDPTRSGFVGARPVLSGLDDLPAIPVDPSGAAQLHLRLPKKAGADQFGRAVRVVERIALRGRLAHPVVDAKPGGPGLTVVVGTVAELGEDADLLAAAARGKGVQLLASDSGVATLLVTAPSEADLDRVIGEFGDAIPDPAGTPEGLRTLAASRGLRVRPGEAISLAEAGIPTTAFSGRLYRAAFDVVLPPDAYLGDYAQALLSFDGGYAAGLARDAVLIVRVNGTTDGVLGLDRSGGATLQNHIVHMPLTAFRPGRNHIEIEAQLPAKADEECDTLASIGAKERFLMLGTSSLTLPPLARIAQFPGLSASFVGGFRVTRTSEPQLFFPRATPEIVSAAATLIANAAAQTGQPTNARVSRERPKADGDPTLVFAAAADMPEALLAAGGIDAKALAGAWSKPGKAKRPDVTGAIGTTDPAPPPMTLAAASDADRLDADRLDAWGERVDKQSGWLGPTSSALDWIAAMAGDSLRAAGIIATPPNRVSITADTSFVLTQGLLQGTALTLVTAPDEASVQAGVAAITEPDQLSRLSGKAASLTGLDEAADIVPTRDTHFFPTQPFSVQNYRLIGAGWLSNHAVWYIGAVLLITLLLGASTWAALTFSRRSA